MHKLSIGTVQFGLPYGVANKHGQVSLGEASKIIALARKENIDMLDTAISYGDSESILGQIGISDFNVVTKLPPAPDGLKDSSVWVGEQINNSLKNLKQKQLYGLLLHKPNQLMEKNGDSLYNALLVQKSQGLVEKIGVSVYSAIELDAVLRNFDVDLVQLPINLFDRSIEIAGLSDKLKEKKIEVHARSIFLQGLLLIEPDSRPHKFSRWDNVFKAFDHWLVSNNISRIEAALNYVHQLDFVDKLVVGVDCKAHLEQILASVHSDVINAPVFFDSEDKRLINPSKWSEL